MLHMPAENLPLHRGMSGLRLVIQGNATSQTRQLLFGHLRHGMAEPEAQHGRADLRYSVAEPEAWCG